MLICSLLLCAKSHGSSNLPRPQLPPTSATTNVEPHSPATQAQRPSRPVSPNLFEFTHLNNTSDFDPKPARPDIIVIDDSDSPVESEAESESSIARETDHVSKLETQPERSQRQSLIGDMFYVMDALPVVIKHGDRGPELVQQTYRRMANLTEHFYGLTQAFPPRTEELVSGPSAPKPMDYYCIPCQVDKTKPVKAKTLWLTVRNFSRHMKERHYQDHEFHCPQSGCPRSFVRRHNLVEHLKTKHDRGATDTEINDNIVWLPYPPHCSLCGETVHSWEEFYSCITRHCRDRARELSKGPKALKPNAGGGRIGKLRQSSTRVVPSSSPLAAGAKPTSKQRSLHRGVPSGNSHPSPAASIQGDEQAPGQEGMHLDPYEAGNSQQPRGSRFPPGLPSQELGYNSGGLDNWHCIRCEHPFAACVECVQKTENSPFCHACPPPLMTGLPAEQGPVPEYLDHFHPPLRQSIFYPTHSDTFDQNIYWGSHLDPEQNPDPQYWSSWGAPGNQMRHFRPRSSSQVEVMTHAPSAVPGGIGTDCISLSKSNVAEPAEARLRRLAVKQPIPSELDPLLREFSKLTLSGKCTSAPPPPILLLSDTFHDHDCLTNPNPDKISTTPCSIASTTLTRSPRCPCRTATKLRENCSGHAVVPLAPGKKLEMDLRILAPEDRGQSHHLRTRVQIVVKLRKLRSSASQFLREKKKRDEAKRAFEQALKSAFDCVPNEQLQNDTDDSEDSDGASVVFDEAAASMLSSSSDISTISPVRTCLPKYVGAASAFDDDAVFVPLPCWDSSALPTIRPSSPDNFDVDSLFGEDAVSTPCSCSDLPEEPNASFETTEVSFDLDLESSLCRMSQLSGGLTDGFGSDPASIDAAQVLEYFFHYVLYMMAAMSRSVDDSRGPCSDQ